MKQHGMIIVDDIMYLRSMRRELFVITRDQGIPLVTVRIKASLELCLDRNQKRKARCSGIGSSVDGGDGPPSNIDEAACNYNMNKVVTDSTIRRLYDAFEEPTSEFIFDRHNIVVDSYDDAR